MKESCTKTNGIFLSHKILTHFMNASGIKTDANAFTLYVHYIQMINYREIDDQGCIFYTVPETMEHLGWTKPRIHKARKALQEVGLIGTIIKVGQYSPYKQAISHLWINPDFYGIVEDLKVTHEK